MSHSVCAGTVTCVLEIVLCSFLARGINRSVLSLNDMIFLLIAFLSFPCLNVVNVRLNPWVGMDGMKMHFQNVFCYAESTHACIQTHAPHTKTSPKKHPTYTQTQKSTDYLVCFCGYPELCGTCGTHSSNVNKGCVCKTEFWPKRL